MNRSAVYYFLMSLVGLLTACSSGIKTMQNELAAARYNSKLPDSLSKKQLSGIDLYGKGTEPAEWTIELDFDHGFYFRSANGTNMSVMAGKANIKEGLRTYVSGQMTVDIYSTGCEKDKNTGIESGKIEVTINNKRYVGCSQYLYDYRLSDRWILEKIGNMAIRAEEFPKGAPRIQFNLVSNKMSGTDGCNTISGGIAVEGSRIQFSDITSTRMACKNDQFQQIVSKQFTNKLVDYYIRDGRLYLYLLDDSVLSFIKEQ